VTDRPRPPATRLRRQYLCALLLQSFLLWPATGRLLAQDSMGHYETAHYEIETDGDPSLAVMVGRHMEEIHRLYSEMFSDYGQTERQFEVKVFTTTAEYARTVPEEIAGSTGAFIPRQRLLVANMEGRTAEEVMRTLYHEGFHQFMFEAVSAYCPIWLNEGIAEYFAEATWNGTTFTLGQVPTVRLHIVQQSLRDGSYIRFADLFSLDPRAWVQSAASNARRASLQYTQAWSIVHFLVHGSDGRYVRLLNSYLKSLSDGRDPERAFRDVFGTDLSSFEQAWAQHVMSLTPSAKFVCRDRMQMLMHLAELVYSDPREFESVPDLRNRLLRNPAYAWSITTPTGVRITSQDRDAAAALFRCPFDKGRHGSSFVVLRSLETGEPTLFCNHHPAVVIAAYYDGQSRGRRRVTVEERVRETVRPELLRAIEEAYRR
jgi:hypothetical protein